jgi:xanthine dehydrogenase iron-sulfur cluster and FAD-binding subunit A
MNEMTNSHILVNGFDFVEAASVDEAVRFLAEGGRAAKPIAGGTDLLVQMKLEKTGPELLVGVGGIPELRRISAGPAGLRLGAGATIAEVLRNPIVREWYPALGQACAAFSTTQVQAMGTVGGNLGNASPASDTAPAFIALGATVEIAGPAGRRTLPLEDFFVGPGRSALAVGELIAAVTLPRPVAGTGSAFQKLGRVAADIAKANAGVAVTLDDGKVVAVRVALGSVAPTPMRARGAEAALAGRPLTDETILAAADAAAADCSPIDDVRASAWYRRRIVRALVHDALQAARTGIRADVPGAWGTANGTGTPATAGAPATAPAARQGRDERRLIELRVNGRTERAWVAPNDLLLNVLREQLGLTGAKYGCGIGECSACTVQLDGAPVLSCLVLAVAAVGHDIVTVEGLALPDGTLHPLQEAFLDTAAYQCGYCTPGMLITSKSLLAEIPSPSEDDVRSYLRGNLCRCTGYAAIVRAVMKSAAAVAEK